jgi:hypothetical protein
MKETPENIADYTGLSLASVRRHVLAVMRDAGSRKQYAKDMFLNGLAVPTYNRIAERSTDQVAAQLSAARIAALQEDETPATVAPELPETVARNDSETGATKQGEIHATDSPATGATDSGALHETSVPKTPATVAPKWSADIGNVILSNPNVRFTFVAILVAAQAYMFAMLESKVLAGLEINIAFWAAFTVGVLFEASGFMIARSFPGSRYGEVSVRTAWLVFFLIIQCITNACLIEPFAVQGWNMIGRIIVAIAIPSGLLAYSFLYFKD